MAWIECVPNVSEGRRPEVIEDLAGAVRSVVHVRLLDVDSDADHNRTVLTFVGPPAAVAEAAFRCAREAWRRIDLPAHEGVHPRTGACDVVPFVPLEGATLERCAAAARALSDRLREEGIHAYLYGAACPDGTPLPAARRREREAGRAGTAVGARDLLIAYNVQLETEDLAVAREFAREVRRLPGVRALGFRLASRGCVQVSMNLCDFRRTGPLAAYREVERLAQARGVAIRDSEVVGMVPHAAVEADFAAATRCRRAAVLDFRPGFLDELAAGTPVPAGGSAAAHVGAVAAALVAMTASLGGDPSLAERAERLRAHLTELAARDGDAFRRFLREGESARDGIISVPLEIAEAAGEVLALAREARGVHPPAELDRAGAVRFACAAGAQACATARVNIKEPDSPFSKPLERISRTLSRTTDYPE